MMWFLVRTDHRKEAYVARQIARLGYDSWVPAQLIAVRPHAARNAAAATALVIKEIPILPRRVFCALPEAVDGDFLKIRHLVALERDAALSPLRIPAIEVCQFKAAIDAENTASLALAQRASRKQKARWRNLHDALLDVIEQAKQTMEIAA